LIIAQLPAVREISLEIIEISLSRLLPSYNLVKLEAESSDDPANHGRDSIDYRTLFVALSIDQTAPQQQMPSQDDWMDMAERIDNIQGNDVWRVILSILSTSTTASRLGLTNLCI
jgi:TAG lipase/steryl ester hydrolase/phospholipase A2/LPA acyltransferase